MERAFYHKGVRQVHGRREIWAILGVAAVYGMVVVWMGVTPKERTHLFEYGLVGINAAAGLLAVAGRQVLVWAQRRTRSAGGW